MSLIEYNYILSKARDVAINGRGAWESQAHVEKLTVALILNEPLWIMEMNHSLAQAIEAIGVERCAVLWAAEQDLSKELTASASAKPGDYA